MSILSGLGFLAALLGAEEHISAKVTNKDAQSIANNAQNLYNNTKRQLELSQKKTQEVLLNLGNEKRIILESSMKQFLKYYEKIKHINFIESSGIDELSMFSIDQQGVIKMQQMADIYSSTLKIGVTGAATGTVIALAASGSLAMVGADMALAGSFLAEGAVGTAAGIAGSSLSFAAGITPLGAIAAPVLLFTGISAGMKANENMEKANALYAEAEAASEKMKVSITLCKSICERADMFYSVLEVLAPMFSECTSILAGVINNKEEGFFKKKISSMDFSEEEIRLIAVTRSLAGAIKAIIDTPILSSNGNVSQESYIVISQTRNRIPVFNGKVEEVRQTDYKVRPIPTKTVREIKDEEAEREKTKKYMLLIRNFCAIPFSMLIATMVCGTLASLISKTNNKILFWQAVDVNKIAIWFVVFILLTVVVGKFGNNMVDLCCRIGTALGMSVLFLQFCWNVEEMNHYILFSVLFYLVSFIPVLIFILKDKNCLEKYLFGLAVSFAQLPVWFWVYAFLHMFFGFPEMICLVIAFLLFLMGTIMMMCMPFFDRM